jgi:thiamine biosynthesis protein ThiS
MKLEIALNGERRTLEGPLTVEGLLLQLGLDPERGGLAVEVNRRVVRAAERAARELAWGDEVEIVTLVGGG